MHTMSPSLRGFLISLALIRATNALGGQFVLVAANYANNTISRFDESGAVGSLFANLSTPGWLHSDPEGNVYASSGQASFTKYSPAGVPQFTITTSYQPGDIVTGSDGTIFVADYFGSAIYRYSATGASLGLWVDIPASRSDFLAMDSAGDVYSGSFREGAVRRISSSGEDLGNFVSGFPPYPSGSITGIAFDSNGHFYVANEYENQVHRFDSDGTSLGVFVSTGLSAPYGLAFDSDDNLYVSNFGNSTIRKFSNTGTDLGNFATTSLSSPRDIAIITVVPEVNSINWIAGSLLAGVAVWRAARKPAA